MANRRRKRRDPGCADWVYRSGDGWELHMPPELTTDQVRAAVEAFAALRTQVQPERR